MSWPYAELSHAAKEAGGPEKLLEIVEETAKMEGRAEMLPIVGAALAVGAFGTWGVIKLVNYFKGKRKASPDEIASAKAEIIQGIKEYDAAHPSDMDVSKEEVDEPSIKTISIENANS